MRFVAENIVIFMKIIVRNILYVSYGNVEKILPEKFFEKGTLIKIRGHPF